ncbi:hypothetical protein BC455_22615 [Vibrio harveyi]|nr:hypothetical protein BC455_22615 [Vibrio harveyi]
MINILFPFRLGFIHGLVLLVVVSCGINYAAINASVLERNLIFAVTLFWVCRNLIDLLFNKLPLWLISRKKFKKI